MSVKGCLEREKKRRNAACNQIGQHPKSVSWPPCQPARSVLILPTWMDVRVCLSNQKWAKTHVFVSYLRNVNSQQAKPARKSSDATSDELRCGSRHLPTGASERVPRADLRKSSRESFQLLSHSGHFRQPPARAARAHFLRTPARSGTVAGLWATWGEFVFPAAAPAEWLRLFGCVRVCECACREDQ